MSEWVSALPIAPTWLVLLGLAIGVLSGLLGVGGGVLMTPALHVLGLSMPVAVATTLTQMVGASLSGSFKHLRNKNVSLPLALIFGVPGILGMHVGRIVMSAWAKDVNADEGLSWLYMGLMTYLGLSMLRKLRGKHSGEAARPMQGWWTRGPALTMRGHPHAIPLLAPVVVGFLVGILSALTGLGGGFFYIPAFVFLGGCSIKEAVGTSLATVFLSSAYGAIAYGAAGLSNIPIALLLMVGAIAGAQAGASIAHRSRNDSLQLLFVVLIFAALASMLLKRFHWDTAAHVVLFGSGLVLIIMALFKILKPRLKPPA
ncbi:MAG TPA: sulfite exporter TauE/SafE family protein [Oligoflexus sp.]|uniref:sulfite exporter TauE/SafE family protein n=1 Tax=Oligoflexus sp. TaxID=1971216 RepID=UPI002D39FCFB|nr:sulfite exporter TauE/SafE family protein [Oligoflexus sp.]HYX31585.1 sulfite exporter TauE/SafE family protein [Oligoflexus sp.]